MCRCAGCCGRRRKRYSLPTYGVSVSSRPATKLAPITENIYTESNLSAINMAAAAGISDEDGSGSMQSFKLKFEDFGKKDGVPDEPEKSTVF